MSNPGDGSLEMAVELVQHQMIPFTSAGYSSGSDDGNDDTDPVPSLQDNAITLKDGILKQQQMYTYSEEYDMDQVNEVIPRILESTFFYTTKMNNKWHECDLILTPPHLQINQYRDTKLEIQERQLQHIHKRWFHGNISRREAKYILQDYCGGEGSFLVRTSESYAGKFAISFMHEERVKHVVIETKPDPLTGVVYHITPKGPFFNSLNGLIEEAQHSCIIQNHSFDVVLRNSPPKPDYSWLHTNIRSLSQAELLMGKDTYSRDGSFVVYPNHSPLSPYSVVYRFSGTIIHANIMISQRTSHGLLTLNGVSSPVLYKLIHYFMENPIHSNTVLYNHSSEVGPISNSAIAIEDCTGDRTKNELSFHNGDLITDISRRSHEWCVGDHRGDKQKFFPTKFVRFLTKDELQYIREVRIFYQKSCPHHHDRTETTHLLNLRTDYIVTFETDGLSHIINITPRSSFGERRQSYKLSCNGSHDVAKWYHELERARNILSNGQTTSGTIHEAVDRRKTNGRKKRASCVIS